MARKKKKLYHICGNEIIKAKKGRKHKYYICKKCGLVAVNPDLTDILSSAAAGGAVGTIGGPAGAVIGAGAGAAIPFVQEYFSGKKETKNAQHPFNLPEGLPKHLSQFEKALLLEEIERGHSHG